MKLLSVLGILVHLALIICFSNEERYKTVHFVNIFWKIRGAACEEDQIFKFARTHLSELSPFVNDELKHALLILSS